jgi:hypothetical protein
MGVGVSRFRCEQALHSQGERPREANVVPEARDVLVRSSDDDGGEDEEDVAMVASTTDERVGFNPCVYEGSAEQSVSW